MKPRDIINTVQPLLEEVLAKSAIEVVDIEYRKEGGRWVFRTYIDQESGVNLDTCQQASEIIGSILDKKNLIREPYHLEVSSPGLDRVIKKDKDFIRFSGRKVKLKTTEPLDGQKKFTGILQGLEDGHILLEVEGKLLRIPRNLTTQVRLVVEV